MSAVASSNVLSSAFCLGSSGFGLVYRPNPSCARVTSREIACKITVETDKILRLLKTKGTETASETKTVHRFQRKGVRNTKIIGKKHVKEKPEDVFAEDSHFKASFEDYIKVMDEVKRNRDEKKNEEVNNKAVKENEEEKKTFTEEEKIYLKKKIIDDQIDLRENFRHKAKRTKFKDDSKSRVHYKDSDSKPRLRIHVDRRVKTGPVETKGKDEKKMIKLNERDSAELRKKLVNSSAGDMSWLLDNAVDADVGDDSRTERKAFGFSRELKPKVALEKRVQLLAEQLNSAYVKMPEGHFSKLMHSAKMKFTDHSMLKLVQVLGNMGNWRRALQVVQWLHNRERYKYCKSRHVYTTVLDILGKAGRPVEALNVFHAMREEFCTYPDMPAYHSIAVTLGQAGYIKELLDVMDCMQNGPEKTLENVPLRHWNPCLQPDLVIYNALVNACIPCREWNGAIWVLQKMSQSGVQPNSATYGLVMEVMLNSGKYDLVYNFFEKMEKLGLIPNTLTYKVLVQASWKEGKVDEAVTIVKEMERRGIVGSASLYYELARCLCSVGRCQDALLQVEKIRKVARKPLYVTYTGLIQTCMESGHLHDCISIFHHMQKFCAPNIVTCNIMMKLYGQNHMFEEAKSLFQEIRKGRVGSQSLCDSDPNLTPDIITYTAMLEACVVAGEWDYFENVYQKMLLRGYQYNNKQHAGLIVAASKAGKGHLLYNTFDELVESGRIPHVSLYTEVICQSLQAGAYTKLISYVNSMAHARLNISENEWMELFEKNVDCISKENLQELLYEVNSLREGNGQTNHIMRNLINSLQHMSELCTQKTLQDDLKPLLH
eukprot:Gb_38669 [translate_table: standard]